MPTDTIDRQTDPERAARMALSAVVEPGNAWLADLLDAHDAAEALDRLLVGHVAEPLRACARSRLERCEVDAVIEQVDAATRNCGADVIIPGDEDWPEQVADLTELADESDPHTRPPLALWVRGRARLGDALRRSVSIVGARDCTGYGRRVAADLAFGLADSEWCVLSGGAYGIDGAAHRGAMAADGITVAVLACGVDRPYPRVNTELFEAIIDSGLLVSEWPPGAIPQRHRFLVRNRLIAAATCGTVVVEAGLRSGARHTARRAAELDRPVMIVPGPITSAASAGVHQLARGPGEARIVTRAAEIIEDLGRIGADLAPPLRGPDRPHDRLDPMAARVLEAVPRRVAAPVDRIAAQATLSVTDVRRVLPTLLMHGMVAEHHDHYRLTNT